MKMSHAAALLLTLSLSASVPALAQSDQTQTQGQTDQTQATQPTQANPDPSATLQALSNITTASDFVTIAAMSGKFEIDSSKLALSNASSDGIKAFAQKMVDDHTKASEELKAAAKAAGVEAKEPDQLDPRHQQLMDRLSQSQGASFDQAYVEIQGQAHQEAVALFSSYSNKGDNQPLKDFAAKTLPTLENHLAMVTGLKPQ